LQVKPSGTSASVFVLSAFGAKGRFYASSKIKVSVDGGQSYRDAGSDGLDLDSLPADGVFTVQDEKGMTRPLPTNAAQSPMVQVFFLGAKAPANVGGLSIQTNESDFVALIDGKKVFYQRKGPPYAVYNITAGTRQVQIQKDGFRSDPSSVKVEVKPNQVATVTVNLVAVPTQLVVQGAIAGTRVSVGPRQLGVIDSRGELRIEMQPGTYTVTLGKDGYHPRNVNVTVANGVPTTIQAAQARLELITGTISLKKDPSRMRLRVNQIDGVLMETPQVYEEAPDQLVLPAGHYTLTFDAPGYKQDIEGPIGLTDGQTVNVPVKLSR
jgi:PEGA domain